MNSIIQKPWGSFQTLEMGKNHLVKNIIVKPGGKLSLQSHQHRSEHWIVVEGVGTITVNETKQRRAITFQSSICLTPIIILSLFSMLRCIKR